MDRRTVITTLLLLSLFSFSFPMGKRNDPTDNIASREKIYLHIDRYNYYSGETIWFKVYLVDSKTHLQETESKVVYVDLLNPDQIKVSSRIIKIDRDNGAGDFQIPADLQTGEYTIRAYTRYMTNFAQEWFFSKKVKIITADSWAIANRTNKTLEQSRSYAEQVPNVPKTALQFFPEGGNLVNGIISQIAFKAVSADGKGIEVNGSVVDQSGNELQQFQTKKTGMGVMGFVPHSGQNYKAHYTYKGYAYECNFPVSADSGAIIQVIDRNNHFLVIIQSSFTHGTKGYSLIGRQRNKLVSSSKLVATKNWAKIDISKNMMEPGVVQFTLINEKGQPICERLAFVEPIDHKPLLMLDSLKNEYNKNDIIQLIVSRGLSSTRDSKWDMSISVASLSALESPDNALNIQSYLWLASELKGEIEHPSYYLFSPDPERKRMLDLLMMIQGWRQFIINDTVPIRKVRYQPENGLCFRGHIKRFNESGRSAKAKVSLVSSNKLEDVYYETTTDDSGYFAFDDLDFVDSTKVIIQVKKTSKKEDIKDPYINFVIVLDSLNTPIINQKEHDIFAVDHPNRINEEVKKSPEKVAKTAFQLQKGDILIDEVLVTKKKKVPHQEKRTMYLEPSYVVDFNEIRRYEASPNLLDILKQRTPSQIFNERLSVNNDDGMPLFLLDGMPVNSDAALSIPTSEIDFVDILERSKTIIFGSSGSKGVVAIYTLDGSKIIKNSRSKNGKCILNFMHQGFSRARKFYEPVYPLTKSTSEKQAESFTIYWNPSVTLDDQNRISFHAPETVGTYQLTLEGINSEGEVIHNEAKFDVK